LRPADNDEAHEYLVVFDGDAGETARLSERDLWPIPGSLAETPLTKLTSLQSDAVTSLRAREGLLRALQKIEHESAGIRALAAGRVALLPHQAFVIGTVVDDPVWRYILADEVGLGKTIEAGAIAHQLLTEKPDARILVLCPGSLTRQWLCEMHQSFGGRNFRLLDLHGPGNAPIETWHLVIASMKVADRHYGQRLLARKWDLVIVDEAHRLLWNPRHYALVEQLAKQTPRLLLLSAVPARERETELLKLLRLIDPEKYADASVTTARFSELYAAQAAIGRRVRIVSRQLESLDGLVREQLNEDVQRLLSLPVLNEDGELARLGKAAVEKTTQEDGPRRYRRLVDEVISRYRISRRILKNRRAQLVDAALLSSVERSVELLSYEPLPLEAQISAVALDLLRSIPTALNGDALEVLFRKTVQGLCDPVALFEIASALLAGDGDERPDHRTFEAGAVLDYDEHESLLSACGSAFAAQLDESGLRRWIALLRAGMETRDPRRIGTLTSHLQRAVEGGAHKVLVFAGTHGAAEFVSESLVGTFGSEAVASFRHDLTDADKEDEVLRFRKDPRCRVLVSDESGGEGRNFQFVDELIHFDLPWSVSAIEQRIGRLDRIGRTRTVRSFVLCPAGGIEEAWFRCLRDGFGVFSRSISGLEFMLHSTERLVVSTALSGGSEGLVDIVSTIREASERERATDDAEAVTDAASFRATSRYLQPPANEGDALLETALPAYLRSISSERAAKKVTDRKDLSLRIWRLAPDVVTDYELPGLQRQGDTPLSDRFGTFSRSIARDRPDLEFFAVGHPLVDALGVALHGHIRGRTFLARLRTAIASPSTVALSAWRVRGLNLDGPSGVPELALRRLRRRVVWVAVDLSTYEALDLGVTTKLVAALSKGDGAADLDRGAAFTSLDIDAGIWPEAAKALVDRLNGHAQAAYGIKFAESDSRFCEQLSRDAEEVSRTRPDEGERYARERRLTVDAIEDATLELDVVGLLKIESSSM
jgi:ATP-dependent helicase HepA